MEPIVLRQFGVEGGQEMVSLTEGHEYLWFVRVVGGGEGWGQEGGRKGCDYLDWWIGWCGLQLHYDLFDIS